jgi:eukaryotic-like serine/threonine-protein kinase
MLVPGTRLGSYEIVSTLGAGGMGEVYKARDTRLDRTVAVKILSSEIASFPDLRERFEREARAVASLNHPHICTLHDIGRQDATDFLVMEYLNGETLEQRLKKGASPVDQSLRIGVQIADALAAAHRAGIIHRDLKPGNIMLTKSGAKLLDFGLAKTGAPVVTGSLSMASTTPPNLTVQGAILGTFQYMAPEQLEGHEADARTDIFAFGAVLYEMVTGKKAFEGQSQASLIGAILEREPASISKIQAMSPPALDRLVSKCLAKNPDARWQTSQDLRDELAWIAEDVSRNVDANSQPTNALSRRWPLVTAAVLVGIVFGGLSWLVLGRSSQPNTITARLSFARPPGTTLTNTGRRSIDISPDGTKIVFVANQRLYLRSLDASAAEPISGTESTSIHTPVLSPDGQWVAFQQNLELRKIPLGGGVSVTIYSGRADMGLSWDTSDRLVFANDNGVYRVAADGGSSEKLFAVDAGEAIYGPRMLPDGDHVLFTATNVIGPDRWDKAQVVVQSISTGKRTVLLTGGSDARYIPTGHLIYANGTSLFAVRFDEPQLRVEGAPTVIESDVRRAALPANNTGAANYSISRDGTLVYLPDEAVDRGTAALVDMEGRLAGLRIVGENLRVSPAGDQVAVFNPNDEAIWIHDLSGTDSPRRLTLEGVSRDPTWSPDGRWITFWSNRVGGRGIYRQRTDGSGSVEPLVVPLASGGPVSWSKDGATLFYVREGEGLWSVAPGGMPRSLLSGARFGNASLSPDERWVAFHAREGNLNMPYIQSVSGADGKYAISSDGGHHPLWAPDGRRLFYVANDSQRLMAVDVNLLPAVSFGQPFVVLEAIEQRLNTNRYYDIMPDGRHLLVLVPSADRGDETQTVEVVIHWIEKLKRLVPVS